MRARGVHKAAIFDLVPCIRINFLNLRTIGLTCAKPYEATVIFNTDSISDRHV